MSRATRWGILSTGWIARRMAEALAVLPDAELIAVASRRQEAADAFGREYNIPLRFGSYEDLVACDDVDIVYVGTPHARHLDDARLALRAGKPVLCEKPLTVNAREAEALIAESRSRRVFLMEAMWTRFVPAIAELREWLAEGAIGEPRLMTASIGWKQPYDPESRIYNPDLAGGSLLDIGIYPIALASMVFGPPADVAGLMTPVDTGVDGQCAVSLSHASGALATFVAGLPFDVPREATIVGTEGFIRIPEPLTHPESLTRGIVGGAKKTVELPHLGNGYPHEAIEVMDCLRAGRLESEIMPLDESLSILRTLDRIREPWGLSYPADAAQAPA